MNIDSIDDLDIAPIGTPAPKAVIPMEIQIKKGKITKLTMNNNAIHDKQKGQVRTIMTYDIPTTPPA
ncbi:hypothetical protein RhiirA1_469504 [Rhizophagus irregularis]|uniref:Uncharacterized protein n=1 Tax=Rhizophagus irregularis TaxID=588596 RepID=A0A2N0R7W2_9GLOM|nr:hypothetical protein RhiirA1_469504 [Rhizophagus irregularis]